MVCPVSVGIVGGGIRGSMFAQVVQEHSRGQLIGFVEPADSVAANLKLQFDVPVCPSVPELIDRGVDALVVATPDFAHAEAGLAAIEADLHVLIEKPLASTAADAQRLRGAAARSRGKVMVGFENRWNPKFQAVRDLMRRTSAPIIAQRSLLQDTAYVPRQMLSWAARSTPGWFLFPHTLDLAMWLSGARPVEVYARGVKKILIEDGIDTYDRISASFLMSDESILDLDSGWVLPQSRPTVFEFRHEVEIRDDQYVVEIDRTGITRYGRDAVSYVGAPATDARGRLQGSSVDMMRDFIDLCDGADVLVPGIEDGYQVTMAIAALHDSLRHNTNTVIQY